jgi:hypothetical protein
VPLGKLVDAQDIELMKTVVIVLDPDLAGGVAQLQEQYPAWVVDSQANRNFWNPENSVDKNSALFRVTNVECRLENLIATLPDLEDHFGPDSDPVDPFDRIRVVGLALSSDTEAELRDRGFVNFSKTKDGFEADVER